MFQFSECRPGDDRDPEEVLAEQAMHVRGLAEHVRKHPDQRNRIEEQIEASYTRRGQPLARQWFDAMLEGKDDFGYPKYLDAITTPPPLPEGFVEKPQTKGLTLEARRSKIIRECGKQREALLRYYRNEKADGLIMKVPGVTPGLDEAKMLWFLLVEGKLYLIPKNGKHTINRGRAFAPVGRIKHALELLDEFQKQLVAKHLDNALLNTLKKG